MRGVRRLAGRLLPVLIAVAAAASFELAGERGREARRGLGARLCGPHFLWARPPQPRSAKLHAALHVDPCLSATPAVRECRPACHSRAVGRPAGRVEVPVPLQR